MFPGNLLGRLIQSVELIEELNRVAYGMVLIGHAIFSMWGQLEVGPATRLFHKVGKGLGYARLLCNIQCTVVDTTVLWQRGSTVG